MWHKYPVLLTLCLLCLARATSARENPRPAATGRGSEIPAVFTRAISTTAPPCERLAAQSLLASRIATSRPFLYAKLTGGNSLERQVAAAILGAAGDARDESILIQALGTSDPILYLHAATALKDIYRRLDLTAQLARLDYRAANPGEKITAQAKTYIRAAALCAIALGSEENKQRSLGPSQVKKILPRLADPETLVRRMAAAALGFAASPEVAAPALIQALQADPDAAVKRRAAHALGKLQGDGRAALKQALKGPDQFLRLEAAAALVKLGEIDYLKILHHSLATGAAPEKAGTGGIKQALDLLHRGKGESGQGKESIPIGGIPVSPLRMRALELLEELGSPFSEGPLAKLLDDQSWRVRAAAAQALGSLRGVAITQPLQGLLSDPDPRVRSKAALALAAQGAVGIPWTVMRDLENPSPLFRAAAAQTLGLLQAVPAIEKLAKLARDKDLKAACAAAGALGKMPRGNSEAIMALLKILDDQRFAVQAQAALALQELTGLPFPSKPAEARRNWESSKPDNTPIKPSKITCKDKLLLYNNTSQSHR